MSRKISLVVCILLAFSTFGFAKDMPLTKSQLPPVVRKAADQQSKGSTVRGYSSEVENGKLEYAEILRGAASRSSKAIRDYGRKWV